MHIVNTHLNAYIFKYIDLEELEEKPSQIIAKEEAKQLKLDIYFCYTLLNILYVFMYISKYV
jgi:hypothetical protein